MIFCKLGQTGYSQAGDVTIPCDAIQSKGFCLEMAILLHTNTRVAKDKLWQGLLSGTGFDTCQIGGFAFWLSIHL